MGWYQDNFPGSTFAKQRTWLGRIFLVYAVACGGLIYAYAPFVRRYRQAIENGNGLNENDFLQTKRLELERNRFFGVSISTANIKEDFLEMQREKERINRQDLLGPDVSEERIRMIIMKPQK